MANFGSNWGQLNWGHGLWASPTRTAGGVSNGYSFYRTITIDHTKVSASDQASFPVLISGTYASLATVANGGHVTNSSGFDIIFTTDSGGNSQLNYERVVYTATTGLVEFWVNVPSLSHTVDTVIYLWYGNSNVSTDQSHKTATWNSAFQGAWHFADGSTLSVADSTINNITTTNHSATATTGQIDGGAAVTAGNYVEVANNSVLNSTTGTVSLWFKSSQNSGFVFLVGRGDSTQSQSGFTVFRDNSTGEMRVQIKDASSGGVLDFQGTTNCWDGAWHQFALSFDRTNTATIYIDGASQKTGTPSGAWSFNGQVSRIGTSIDSFWAQYIGSFDELHWSNVVRSADWILTEYNNQSSPSTFYAVGSEVAFTGVSIVGQGVMTGTGTLVIAGASNIVGQGVMTGSGGVLVNGAGDIVGQALMTATGGIVIQGGSDIVGQGILYFFSACPRDATVILYNWPLATVAVVMPIAYVTEVLALNNTMTCGVNQDTIPVTGSFNTLVELSGVPQNNQ